MIQFSEVIIEPTNKKRDGRRLYRVVKPIEVRLNGSFLCIIEEGFESDGASIPFFASFKWKSWGRHSAAAILHDHLLETSDHTKWLVDILFYLALRSLGVPALEAHIFYFAVRLKREKSN